MILSYILCINILLEHIEKKKFIEMRKNRWNAKNKISVEEGQARGQG